MWVSGLLLKMVNIQVGLIDFYAGSILPLSLERSLCDILNAKLTPRTKFPALADAEPNVWARDASLRFLGRISKIDPWSFINVLNDSIYDCGLSVASRWFHAHTVRLFVCVRVLVSSCLCVSARMCVASMLYVALDFFNHMHFDFRLQSNSSRNQPCDNLKLPSNGQFCFSFARGMISCFVTQFISYSVTNWNRLE